MLIRSAGFYLYSSAAASALRFAAEPDVQLAKCLGTYMYRCVVSHDKVALLALLVGGRAKLGANTVSPQPPAVSSNRRRRQRPAAQLELAMPINLVSLRPRLHLARPPI